MSIWKNLVSAFVLALVVAGVAVWDAGKLTDWRCVAAMVLVSASFALLPLAIQWMQQRREARSYARLLARVR